MDAASKGLSKEVIGLSILLIIIVVFNIVLNQMKDVTGVTAALNTSIDEGAAALLTPIDWFNIIIIIVVVAWLLYYLTGKKSESGGLQI